MIRIGNSIKDTVLNAVILPVLIVLLSTCSTSESEKEPQRPNILFAIMDDATYQHMGAYGCKWVSTPAFDQVANQGLLFTRAYTPNAKCAPSRSCILTGRNPWQLEQAANHWPHFPSKFKTYPEVLDENGYHVGYTDKGWAPGIANNEDGTPRLLTGKPYNDKLTQPPGDAISSIDYAANFTDFLESNSGDKPFCFWFGSKEPHRAYNYGIGIEKGGKALGQIDEVYSFFPNNDTVRTDLLDYAFEIEYFDKQLGKMLKILEDKALLENTMVVVTSDNGMPFPRVKGQEYEYSNHMPLAIMWKGGITNPGRTIDDLVNFTDFAPTFLRYAKVAVASSGMQPMIGTSFERILESDKSGLADKERKDYVLIGKERHDVGRPHDQGYPIRGIVKGDYLFIRNFEPTRWPSGNPITGYLNCDGSPTKTNILEKHRTSEEESYWEATFGKRPKYELYNIKKDAECMVNLATDSTFASTLKELNELMVSELKTQADPRMLGNGAVFDNYPYADDSGVNFYERYLKGEKLYSGWVSPEDFEESDFDQ